MSRTTLRTTTTTRRRRRRRRRRRQRRKRRAGSGVGVGSDKGDRGGPGGVGGGGGGGGSDRGDRGGPGGVGGRQGAAPDVHGEAAAKSYHGAARVQVQVRRGGEGVGALTKAKLVSSGRGAASRIRERGRRCSGGDRGSAAAVASDRVGRRLEGAC